MRTTKRFTPDLLDRFRAQGRGLGTYEDYVPWHRLSRGDPASRGRSHLQMWRGRQRELLSDNEWECLLFATMLPDVIDVREQFPLSLESSSHELAAYDVRASAGYFPGTLEIAKSIEEKHPRVNGNGRSAPWVMSTDFLLCLHEPGGTKTLLAIAFKSDNDLKQKRTNELLRIEQAYWRARNVKWLLVSSSLYDKRVALTLRRTCYWGLEGERLKLSIDVQVFARAYRGRPLYTALRDLANVTGSMELAQLAFWQSVWNGTVPLNLCRGWRPHIPIDLLPISLFWEQNPIASRRSLWN